MAKKRSGDEPLDEAFWRRVQAAKRRNQKHARSLLARIRNLEPELDEEFHAVGDALIELSEKRYYKALDYDTFAECLAGEELFSKPTAYKLMAVARTFAEDLALDLGFEKAYALIGWAREAGKDAEKLARSDRRIGGTRISELSVRKLVAQTRLLKRTGAGADPEARAAERAANLLRKALRARGARRVRVEPQKQKDGWHLLIDVHSRDAGSVT